MEMENREHLQKRRCTYIVDFVRRLPFIDKEYIYGNFCVDTVYHNGKRQQCSKYCSCRECWDAELREEDIMKVITNDCCGCAAPAYPCLGDRCPLRSVEHHYCDQCGDEPEKLYRYEDRELCLSCIESMLEPIV